MLFLPQICFFPSLAGLLLYFAHFQIIIIALADILDQFGNSILELRTLVLLGGELVLQLDEKGSELCRLGVQNRLELCQLGGMTCRIGLISDLI
jgi:hypothetical protein